MDIANIKSLVNKGESINLEFKLKSNHPKRILNELVAFANTKGGKLLIGIDDSKKIVGLDAGDEDIYLLEKLIYDQIYPTLPFKMQKITVSKTKEIVLIEVTEGKLKPYYVNENPEKRNGVAYIRLKDQSIKAGKILRMMMNSKFKDQPNSISIADDIEIIFSLMKSKEKVSFDEIRKAIGKNKRITEVLLLKMLNMGLIGFDLERQDEFYLKEPEEK